MSSDVIVSHVTFSLQELALRLNQNWRFLVVERGKVSIHGEVVADFVKRGPTVLLTPAGPREPVRWVAWAIQSICPDSEANDEEATPPRIADEPMSSEDVEKMARGIVDARLDAIAKEADPGGGAREAVSLVTYLVEKGQLELCGSMAAVARAIFPLLSDVNDEIGTKLEDALLDLDEVDELFAAAEELTKIVQTNQHIFDR